ncbi:MAG: HAMP domain-containing histidine kinase [Rhodobacteraceae bacterium]|nr:HAMP domain-containing histidine kinase [Paracoccaceae bacterium]
MTSLRRRAIWGAMLWGALTAGLGFFALVFYFGTTAASRFDAALAARHARAATALALAQGDAGTMALYLADPEYARPYSGRYWQAVAADGTVAASRSLLGAMLPAAPPARPAAVFWEGPGPDGPVRGIAQRIELEDGRTFDLRVAESLAALAEERRRAIRSLAAAFALVAVLSVLGAVLLTGAALAPLRRLRQDVMHRWDAGGRLDPEAYPEEVAPLVADINTLLERNRKVIDTARRQAADLAHALKTPIAVLRNEIEAKAQRPGDLAAAREAVDRIDAQILRSLARARAGNAAAAGYRTPLADSAARLARLFHRSPQADGRSLSVEIPAHLTVGMDRQDIEEVLGNLVENALTWCRSEVRVTAAAAGGTVTVRVEDDGPGIPEAQRAEVLRPGVRLDTRAPGSGLGLAIAADLVEAYGGRIGLGTSEALGGLAVTVTLPGRLGILEAPGAAP